jgi:hypothetical protein
MRTFAIVFTLALTGCPATEPDAGDDGTDAGPELTPPQPLTVNWSLKRADGSPDTCTAPYDKVKVRAVAVDRFEAPYSMGSVFEKVFDCAAGTGTIELPTSGFPEEQCIVDCYGFSGFEATGKYFVTLWTTEASGESYRAPSPVLERTQESSPRVDLDVSGGPVTHAFTFYPNAGFFIVGWSLYAASDNRDLSCNASGIDEIRVRLIEVDSDEAPVPGGLDVTQAFTCVGDPALPIPFMEGSSMTSALPPLAYRIEVRGFAGGTLVAERDMSVGEGGNRHPLAGGAVVSQVFPETFSIRVLNR